MQKMDEGVYHLEVKTISRAHGRSAPGAAAYRSGTRMTDERTGEKFDYRRKRGIVFSQVLLPTDAPIGFMDRGVLWNKAEKSEDRKNSCVAREIIIAIPHDLSPEGKIRLVLRFANAIVAKHVVAVDLNQHAPHDEDSLNDHAHLLLSTRRLVADGFAEKSREWDCKKSGPSTTRHWREQWALMVNEALAAEEIDKFIDHRSHKERGFETAPTIKMGVAATAMERRGHASERGDINREIGQANAAILNVKKSVDQVDAKILEIVTAHAPVEPDFPERSTLRVGCDLPIPTYYEHLLAGPTMHAYQAPKSHEVDLNAERIRREKATREYLELCDLRQQVISYGLARMAYDDQYPELLDMKKQFDEMRPPQFASVLKHIGMSKKWDDFIEAKTQLKVKIEAKELEVNALKKSFNRLKSCEKEWNCRGWKRHNELERELAKRDMATLKPDRVDSKPKAVELYPEAPAYSTGMS